MDKAESVRLVTGVFDKAAKSYDNWYLNSIGMYAFRSELMGLEALLPPSGLGVDIGAGTGIFAAHLSTAERDVVCIDPSPGMLMMAHKRGLPAILATAESLPMKIGSLDFAYAVTVIEFLADPVKALHSISVILKEDAFLVLLFINRKSRWGEQYSKQAEEEDPIFSHSKLYTEEEVSSLLEKAGFEPLKTMGTLTAPPDEPIEEYKLVSVKEDVGVILIKARKMRLRRH
jgi:ubiquinone/menaquinone biosynthesis C-methylase UbiE